MSKPKTINYDFSLDTFVSVEAPPGTDPDTLLEECRMKLALLVAEGGAEFAFEKTFDPETGEYSATP